MLNIRFFLMLVGVLAASSAALAETNTKFPPDVVMECIEPKTGKLSSQCEFRCFTIPRPADGPTSSWPSIVWLFERLEFFSKPGRESENWLVSIKGRVQSPAIHTNSKFFITIGTAFLCVYSEGTQPLGAEPIEVRLTKYY